MNYYSTRDIENTTNIAKRHCRIGRVVPKFSVPSPQFYISGTPPKLVTIDWFFSGLCAPSRVAA